MGRTFPDHLALPTWSGDVARQQGGASPELYEVAIIWDYHEPYWKQALAIVDKAGAESARSAAMRQPPVLHEEAFLLDIILRHQPGVDSPTRLELQRARNSLYSFTDQVVELRGARGSRCYIQPQTESVEQHCQLPASRALRLIDYLYRTDRHDLPIADCLDVAQQQNLWPDNPADQHTFRLILTESILAEVQGERLAIKAPATRRMPISVGEALDMAASGDTVSLLSRAEILKAIIGNRMMDRPTFEVFAEALENDNRFLSLGGLSNYIIRPPEAPDPQGVLLLWENIETFMSSITKPEALAQVSTAQLVGMAIKHKLLPENMTTRQNRLCVRMVNSAVSRLKMALKVPENS